MMNLMDGIGIFILVSPEIIFVTYPTLTGHCLSNLKCTRRTIQARFKLIKHEYSLQARQLKQSRVHLCDPPNTVIPFTLPAATGDPHAVSRHAHNPSIASVKTCRLRSIFGDSSPLLSRRLRESVLFVPRKLEASSDSSDRESVTDEIRFDLSIDAMD